MQQSLSQWQPPEPEFKFNSIHPIVGEYAVRLDSDNLEFHVFISAISQRTSDSIELGLKIGQKNYKFGNYQLWQGSGRPYPNLTLYHDKERVVLNSKRLLFKQIYTKLGGIKNGREGRI